MEVVNNIPEVEFVKFLSSHHEVNFLQSIEWGDAHKLLGDEVIRMGIKVDGKLASVWLGIIKDARRGRYLEIPGGPVLDWSNEALAREVIAQLKLVAKKHKCVFVRFRPQLLASDTSISKLNVPGVVEASMHLHAEHTNMLNVLPTEEELLAGMRRQTRYEVRRAEKRGVVIESSAPSVKDIELFYQIQQETAKRHGFVQSKIELFQGMRQSFGDNLQLYTAKKDDKLLNLALVIHHRQESDYFEAASTPEARKEPGAYGIVWQAIKDAKVKGSSRLNLWGIAYSDNPNHRYAGVTTFKRGFGGEDVEYIPAHDIVVDKIRYRLNWLVETARKKKRGL